MQLLQLVPWHANSSIDRKIKLQRSIRGKIIDEGISGRKYNREKTIRIERRGIEKDLGFERRKWTEEKENNLQTLRSLRLMEYTPAGQTTPAAHGLRNYIKKINSKLSPTPNNWGGWLCLYCHQGSQNKHLPMDSAHQRYRLIHYKLLDSYKSTTAHSAHQSYLLIHYTLLDSSKYTTALYTNTDSFLACDLIGILF